MEFIICFDYVWLSIWFKDQGFIICVLLICLTVCVFLFVPVLGGGEHP